MDRGVGESVEMSDGITIRQVAIDSGHGAAGSVIGTDQHFRDAVVGTGSGSSVDKVQGES